MRNDLPRLMGPNVAMKPITFTYHAPEGDRRHVATEAEVRVVLDRLPSPLWDRLAAVHFNDGARSPRSLGHVTRGRTEISLCALPPRINLASFLRRSQSPSRFGAVRGCQWPGLAVRRFMLYDVFLHELGHMQVVDEKAKRIKRKFASETRAQEFAEHWCRELWSQPFDHPDPVHNPPTPEEIETVRGGWRVAHSDYKKGLLFEKAKRYEEAVVHLSRAVERYPAHSLALERLGVLTYAGHGTTQSNVISIERLGMAVRLDPALFDANLFLGLALARQNRETEARRCFVRAIRLDSHPPLGISVYADVLADWGYFAHAEALFQKAIKRNKDFVLAIRNYGRTLIRDHNPEADNNIGRAIELFERAVAIDPGDAESHYRLGNALLCVDGERERAIGHLERALKIEPTHAKAAEELAEIESERDGRDES
jgi:Flp pilus assembly protein TadD